MSLKKHKKQKFKLFLDPKKDEQSNERKNIMDDAA